MPLTPEQRVIYEQRLAEAESAWHDLQLGQSARVVVDGLSAERVEFTSANSSKLYGYILTLKSKLGLLDPDPSTGALAPEIPSPIRFLF